MKTVADKNNPYVADAFATLGEVDARPGKTITREALADADILASRSTIQINAELLEGTPVKYVGTATIGTDHMDMAWMDAHGIRHCNAAGCNADSVADYMTCALLHVARERGITLEGMSIGVVGCGNVGSRVVKRAQALGMCVIENDPPLARETGDARYRPIDELLDCDIITFHVPLTKEGPDATHHLADADFLAKLRDDCLLFNASRGPVVANDALKAALREGRLAGAVLDVWEGEPSADPELADLVYLATPHIAGHSFDGKVNGTNMVYRQICEWLGRKPGWTPEPHLPEPLVPLLKIDATGRADEDAIREACFAVYPIQSDDATFRDGLESPDAAARAAAFSAQRSNYPMRREFALTKLELTGASEALRRKLAGLTFQV